MGPLWLDVEGYEIDAEERELLQHPTVGGLILFARNYHDPKQLAALTASIRKAAGRPILIGVDQEGGRVQRFRDEFTLIPPAQAYAEMDNGLELAKTAGWLLCAELVAHDIDLTFAPVLDNGFDCKAIGNRAFGDDINTIVKYSTAFMQGMKSAGTSTTGKHFPGHGGVIADSHLETPYDNRNNIFELDMAIFKAQIEAGILDAMMPAHVIYSEYDSSPASGSSYWLKDVLRKQLNFNGLVFSDDLSMEGATIMGGPAERSQQALDAGCDMLLMCNNRKSAVEVLDNLAIQSVAKADALLKTQHFDRKTLLGTREWKEANELITRAYEGWKS
ncbi:beta-N-acetylhexosaminidase [Aliivibrio fischeri]|uniref:beta-N-acetylhexosaminidase n=1 Tax=Aliivibrio fischeri TaxID=668 RepID=UPI0012D85A53|nr:beta-N-acetylhexosaminidase [Aliivibrio fischeri]MUL01534.1 beta-N-acetylhexosaminidase [Aliivibrio fischeri]